LEKIDNISKILNYKEIDNLELLAKQIVDGFIIGLHRSPYRGFSVEFAEHRLYNQGESTKHIDWKVYGRTDKLFVKQFEEETNLRAQIIIDCSNSMLFSSDKKSLNKLHYSCILASSLIHLLKKQRDAFGLYSFSNKLEIMTEAKLNESHSKYIFNELRKLMNAKPSQIKETKISDSLHKIAEQSPKRSLIILFTDFIANDGFDEIKLALQHLQFNKNEIIVFNIRDEKLETKFNFPSKTIKFVDLETGEKVSLNPETIKKEYLNAQTNIIKDLKLFAGRIGIDFVDIDINENFTVLLKSFLLKRSKMM
jgi:uncharacterized protein (DUF58 family)